MAKPTHRERLQLARQRRKTSHGRPDQAPKTDQPCPTSKKRRYWTQGDAAADALELSRRAGWSWVPYECECGRWHLAGKDRSYVLKGWEPPSPRKL